MKLAEWFGVDPNSMSFSDLGHMCRRLPTQSTYGDAQECGAAVEFRRISSKLPAPVGSCRTGRLGSCEVDDEMVSVELGNLANQIGPHVAA